jgi:phage protein
LEQLNEIVTKKVTVPQYVEDWIEYCKTNGIALGYALYCSGQASDKKVYDWIVESLENQETFARAWIDGYEIEKEKRYEVILSNGQSLKTVYRQGSDRLDFEKVYGDIERFTRKQLEEAGFGWVFDCEGMEVKEV